VRSLAFYLPQYHPIPENDEWWGRGFTEWRNVVRAKPLFKDHYQPHLPADLGFYDLRVPETREAQAELASSYGITGFCYYHYWFNGRRLLNRPFDEVLSTGRPEFPFCLCWANENWTRRWDGREQDVLLGQQYSLEDDLAHIEHLLPAFADDRYVKIEGRPLFLVYRSSSLPNPARTTDVWRDACRRAGFPDLYLARVEGYGPDLDPASIGFNAAVEFAPDWNSLPPAIRRRDRWDGTARLYHELQKMGLMSSAYLRHWIYSYAELSQRMRLKAPVPYTRFRCATPGWDNSPRRERDATIFHDSSPELYEEWLGALVQETLAHRRGSERIVFVNAWNEWAEGNHLEPDRHWGRAYLEATSRALRVGTSSRFS
jgi:lipopolysaccharide biosynthesis protein